MRQVVPSSLLPDIYLEIVKFVTVPAQNAVSDGNSPSCARASDATKNY